MSTPVSKPLSPSRLLEQSEPISPISDGLTNRAEEIEQKLLSKLGSDSPVFGEKADTLRPMQQLDQRVDRDFNDVSSKNVQEVISARSPLADTTRFGQQELVANDLSQSVPTLPQNLIVQAGEVKLDLSSKPKSNSPVSSEGMDIDSNNHIQERVEGEDSFPCTTVNNHLELSQPDPVLPRDLIIRIDQMEQDLIPRLENNLLTLEEGTDVLGQLQQLYRQTNINTDNPQGNRIRELINRVEPLVCAMNNASSSVTRRDFQMFASFFSPPLERIYIDPVDNQHYALADNSHLVTIAAMWWANNLCYAGIEVSKCNRVVNHSMIRESASLKEGGFSHRYDAIFYKKSSGELSYERSFLSFARMGVNIKSIKKQQLQMHKRIYEDLVSKFKAWGYAGFCILTTQDQLRLIDLLPEAAEKYHAVILFLNPIETVEIEPAKLGSKSSL